MGDNGGVRALGRSKTVRIGAVLLVLSLVAVLAIVVRNAVRYREAVALDEAGDAQGVSECPRISCRSVLRRARSAAFAR